MHVEELLAAVTFEKVPAGHMLHIDEPELLLNVPGEHGTQVEFEIAPIVVEKLPALHFVHDAAPAFAENDPCAQSVQVALDIAPVAFEKVPTGHKLHNVAPALENRPLPQMAQFVELVTLDAEPARHGVQLFVNFDENVPGLSSLIGKKSTITWLA